MKILIANVRDTGGTGWNLAHAINNVSKGKHHAVNLTAQKSYINYPTMADMGDYGKSACRKMFNNADVIVFLGAFKPFLSKDGLAVQKRTIRDKKKLLLFMGSEWRYGRKQLMQQAEDLLAKNYGIAVGGSGMFLPGEDDEHTTVPNGTFFLPPCRAFTEIGGKYGVCNQDKTALEMFAVPKKRVIFTHAPTSEANKGSKSFYKAVTKAMQLVPNLTFSTVRGQPWVTTLRSLAVSDVLMDQDPPFPEAYGAISVEASIFRNVIVSRIHPECVRWLTEVMGTPPPIIGWKDDDDLMAKLYKLATDEELRKTFGNLAYEWMRKLHDEQPVVDRFMKIVDEID